jgi:hypothetical protein
MDAGDTRFDKIEKSMELRDETLRKIESKVDRLPCVDRGGYCPEEKKKK